MQLEFRPFLLEDKNEIDQFFKPHQFLCSEFTFTNVMIWGQDNKIQWAVKNDILYIQLRFGTHPPFMFPPIPKSFECDYREALNVALRHFYDLGAPPLFRSVNGPFCELILEHLPQFSLSADRNTFDYVYNASDIITLSGRKFHSKRNHIHQFTSQYSYRYCDLTEDMMDDCLGVYKSWLEEKDIYMPGILGEMKAIECLLPNMERFDVKGGCIFADEKLVAFTIGERVRRDLAIIHIEKALPGYPGLYALINQQFAEHNFMDVQYINREEDMGVPGMRKAKLSYHPVMMVEKYDAVLRP